MPTTQAKLNARFNVPSFVRMLTTSAMKDMVKEAKRVKYNVETIHNSDTGKGSVFSYTITDPDLKDALVLKGMQVRPGVWATRFSTDYWQEPTIGS